MGVTIGSPFLPKELQLRGISMSISGWIFGIFSLVLCVSCPIFGKTVPLIGSKFQLLTGTFITGTSHVLFGMLNILQYEDGKKMSFIICAFIIRIFLALGSAACITSTFAIATNLFRDNTATVIGLLESASGVGLMLGPAFGGFLYGAFGFIGPFFFMGFSLLTMLTVFGMVVKTADESVATGQTDVSEKNVLKQLLSIPVIVAVCGSLIISAATWAFIEPTLEPHLRPLNLSSGRVGVVFLLLAGVYTLLSPLMGKLVDRINNSTPLLVIGFLAMAIGLLLLGPSPLLGLQNYRALWLDSLSLVLMGIGCTLSCIPTYNKILRAAVQGGLKESLTIHAMVGALWNACYAFGEFLGFISTGWLVDSLRFPWSSTVIAIADVIMMLFTSALWIYESKIKKPKEDGNDGQKASEEDDVVEWISLDNIDIFHISSSSI